MREITSDVVRELLDYDPETGIFIWKARSMKWFEKEQYQKAFLIKYVGKRAGRVNVNHHGYRRRLIKLVGKPVSEHRLVWLWMTDEPIPQQLDHINRDATDNRWSNIRASDYEQNSKNRSLCSDNKSGINGVHFHKKSRKWVAQTGGKYLGCFEHIEDAAEAVRKFKEENGYSPDHGLEKPRKAAGLECTTK